MGMQNGLTLIFLAFGHFLLANTPFPWAIKYGNGHPDFHQVLQQVTLETKWLKRTPVLWCNTPNYETNGYRK
jgi:hypothetical protein